MKQILLLFFLLALTGCNTADQEEAIQKEDVGALQTGNDTTVENDEMLVESREEGHDIASLSPTEAEALIKRNLEEKNQDDLIIQYDHQENDHYIIHVYSAHEPPENTEAWYMVNIQTHEVQLMKQ
ncbi:hypothetical protein ACNRWW_07605 [Metabacillus sp. HB246100]|uniref:hypothetical protein n=1 Tax=Bacillus weihaiensis TaxID=1547283 RepID=UPI002354FFF4|nr:hypothetical protein [Bacillus weihaiensis]